MIMRFKVFGLAILVAASLAFPAGAHHSHNQYDLKEFFTIEGKVTAVHFLNPHSWVYLEVKDDKGQVQQWALEADGPTNIFANGVKKGDVVPGDTIKARCHKSVDGSNGCLLGYLTPTHGDAARGHGVEKEWD
jgi:hypothetical protein